MALIPRHLSLPILLAYALVTFGGCDAPTASAFESYSTQISNLWDRENLVAWEAGPSDDTKRRTPEERATILQRLGFRHYAHIEASQDSEDFHLNVDMEIEALQRHGVELLAWYFWVGDEPERDEMVQKTLASFARHGVHPQIWISQSFAGYSATAESSARSLPKGMTMPDGTAELDKLPEPKKALIRRARDQPYLQDLPRTREEQTHRVWQEALRVKKMVDLVRPYGCEVKIYNHNGWFGLINNELAIIHRLEQVGVTNVGIVYNFSHARDTLHDDRQGFRQSWAKMMPYVAAVNLSGVRWEGEILFPSQGDGELEMMRIIQGSHWQGPIGVYAGDREDDMETTLKRLLSSVEFLAGELGKSAIGGGPHP